METVSPSANFPEVEARVLEFWKQNNCFQKSLDRRSGSEHYMFYDGPPFATGTPHYGHLLAGTIKDIVPRYQTMKGFFVERRFGWDTHGLPIEMLTEQELGLKGRTDILEYGVGEFNEACRAGVMKYTKEWEYVTGRLGRWIDFKNDYKTMDLDFMDSVWWVFKQLWDKGRIYEGTRVMPYSWRLATPLSNFEAGANYKDVQDPAVTLRFPLVGREKTYMLAWTTTPFSIVSIVGLCVGPDIDYVEVQKGDEHYILAESRLKIYFGDESTYSIVNRVKGRELVDTQFNPLFDYYEHLRDEGAFRVVMDDYVSTEDGTGVVTQSPAHGEDDHRVCLRAGLPIPDHTDREGNIMPHITEFAGRNLYEVAPDIAKALKQKGLLFKQETIQHSFPFCERSETKLMYKAIPSWYVKVEDIRDQMVDNNNTIHWIPEHIKHGRFGKWLEGARDWNISRNRFWGNPLPIWRCDSCEATECVGSRTELEEKAGTAVIDLHKHFVDELHWSCSKCSGTMTRIPEVLDCWFESGSMPYAQLHYPFENKERFEKVFPADFIAEGLDQTRGWFYTLMILSSSLFEKAPFKNCVVNGMILAEDGKKMSKRLKNYPDPVEVMDKLGADALRLYLINSPVVRGETLRFSEKGVRDIVRSVLLPFWNVYSFFTTYANIDHFSPEAEHSVASNVLDRWIESRFQTLVKNIEREMSEYRLYAVVPALIEFLEELTNWYVRRSRRRFWSDDKADKESGYRTMYVVLMGFAKVLAPFLPFVADEIYRNLATLEEDLPESVHLTDYPIAIEALRDVQLESDMELIQNAVGLGRALRARLNLKVRQPLPSITVVTKNESDAEALKNLSMHIEEELNVKQVLFSSHETDLVEISAKPNFPICGPIYGKRMKAVSAALSKLSVEEIESIEKGGSVDVEGETLDKTHIDVVRRARAGDVELETAGGVTVFFDTDLTPELLAEGLAREFVNRVQKMRKDADFQVTDRIRVKFATDDSLAGSLIANIDYIKHETLTVEFERDAEAPSGGDLIENHSIESSRVTIAVTRISA